MIGLDRRHRLATSGIRVPLYFAYGANMDRAAMAERCPRSQAIGRARLMRHRVAIMREGWLTVVRDSRASVHGVLWDLALPDVPALDRFEGVAEGTYIKAIQPVVAGTAPKQALVYIGANAGPGTARADYLRDVIAAAHAWEMPRQGIAALDRLRAHTT